MDPQYRLIIKENSPLLQNSIHFNEILKYLKKYKLFNKYMLEDIHTISDVLELLPTRGPQAFRKFILVLRQANYNTEADLLDSVESSDEYFYKMTSRPLGFCLIINNMKFDPPELEYRHGSKVDATALEIFFKEADFEVTVKSNLTRDKMEECIKTFSMRSDFNNVDSMILIIMSHGGHINNREILYGTDGGHLLKDDIYRMFNNKNYKLQSKPKVFFFIACRGEGKDLGVPKVRPKDSTDSSPLIALDDQLLPEFSDMLIINSSLPYNVTIRNHEKGTYFCQALVPVLNDNYKIHDLETMIKLVNQKLEGNVSEELRIVTAIQVEKVWKKKIMLYRRN